MNTSSKVLVGGLIAVNLLLVGLLLFRDNSVARAKAATPATAATEVGAEGSASTSLAEPVDAAPAPEPAAEVERVVEREVFEAEPVAPARTEAKAHRTSREARSPRTSAPAPARRDPAPDLVASNRVPTQPDPAVTTEIRSAIEPSRPVAAARPPAPVTVTVPAGTHLAVRLDVALNSRQVQNGDKFEASLAQDLVVDGKPVARAGDPITGRVLEVQDSGRVKGREMMQLTLAEVSLAGKSYRVAASSATFLAEDDHGRDAAVVGGSSVVGAIIGGIAKGGKGAATGAAAGAAAGAGVVLGTKGKPVILAAGTPLDFTLEESLRVTLQPAGRDLDPAVEPEERERRETQDDGGIARQY